MVFLHFFHNDRTAYRKGGWDGWKAGGRMGWEVAKTDAYD